MTLLAVPSKTIWFSDGDIILVCERTAFRVHTDVLADHSHIFRDMTDIPQPSGDCPEAYDDCPIVRLQDPAPDMRSFLEAIYDQQCTSSPCPAKVDFTIASALLRLGTKYDATSVRRRAIEIFASVYPSTYVKWRNRDDERSFPAFEGEIAATLALALQNDVRSLLPTIFYAASKKDPSDAISEFLALQVHPSIVQQLCATFISGRERLRQAEIKLILSFFSPSFSRPNCTNLSSDSVRLQLHAAQVIFKTADASYQDWCAANPFKVGPSLGLCPACCELIETTIWDGMEEMWKQLPSMFGLADWDTLREDDELRTTSTELVQKTSVKTEDSVDDN